MKVSCPTCETAVEWNNQSPYRPFCSKRCQLIDLGEWAEENHTIPAEPEKNEINIDPEEIEAMLSQQGDQFFKE